MAALTLRVLTNPDDTTKGLPLTNAEMDQNLINLDNDIATKAPISSPTFTGVPAAPTATAGTATTQIATTAFVTTAVTPLAPKASPIFTGTPTAPTATAGTSTTQIATTEFVSSSITNANDNAIAMAIALG